MKKWNLYAAAVLAAVGILGGCGAKNAETQAQPQNAQASTQGYSAFILAEPEPCKPVI